MPGNDEKNFEDQLRQAQIAAKNESSKTEAAGDPPEEASEAEPELLEGNEAEQAASEALTAERLAATKAAQKEMAEAKVVQLAGNVQKKGGWAVRFAAGRLISFGLGLFVSLIGLIIGIPLLIIGGGLFMIGILGSIVGEATFQLGKSMERKAAQKVKGGGGAAGAAAGAVKEGARRFFQLAASFFANLGCSVAGLLGGFFLICIIAVVLVCFFSDVFGGIFDSIASLFR